MQYLVKIKVNKNKAEPATQEDHNQFYAFCKDFHKAAKSDEKFKDFLRNSYRNVFFQDKYPKRSQLNVAGTDISLVMERCDI